MKKHEANTREWFEDKIKGSSGSLDGYKLTCANCGFVITSTILMNAEMEMRNHFVYMAKQGR